VAKNRYHIQDIVAALSSFVLPESRTEPTPVNKEEPAVLQAELQQDIQRFSTEFTARVLGTLAPLQRAPQPEVRDAAMRQLLLYSSSALDIATEPQPEVGLLDMIVFVTLSRRTVDTHWAPKVFGEKGAELSKTMAQSEAEVWRLFDKVVGKKRREDLEEIIRDWQNRNPDQLRVEGIRFHTFARGAGKLAEEQEKKTSGLLSDFKAALAAADQGVLLAERALFLAHRAPFLLRLQARLGMHEIAGDMAAQIKSGEEFLGCSIKGLLDPTVEGFFARVDSLVRRWLVYLTLIGVAWAVMFGVVLYFFR